MEEILQETVAILNEILGVKPILYASFAVEKVLGRSFNAHDIDILVPSITPEQKDALIKEFAEHGFSYLDQYTGTFTKNGIDVELSDRDHWFKVCGFDPQGTYEISGLTFRYDLLSASNLLKLYNYLTSHFKRDPKKLGKDQVKIQSLQDALDHHTTQFR